MESTDYMGTETQYYYDGVGNLIRTTSPIDNNNTAETLQYYDAEGFLAREKIKTDTNAYREDRGRFCVLVD